ncbi:MAG: hypothetical protein Q9160_006870 [Pyrenula sp. 1 TL-2023]
MSTAMTESQISTTVRTRPETPPRFIPVPAAKLPPLIPPHGPSTSQASYKSAQLAFDTFSPVNQHGCFEFDRVIKSNEVRRRVKRKGAWKPSWKPSQLVLRPNLLSIYRDREATELRASITLSDVTTVARVRKTHTENVFGVFSPSKNYHFQGLSEADTIDWVNRLRTEARVDENDETFLTSPQQQSRKGKEAEQTDRRAFETSADESDQPSSPEIPQWSIKGHKSRSRPFSKARQPSHIQDYSGTEAMTSYSDFSDAMPTAPSSISRPKPIDPPAGGGLGPSLTTRNMSQISGFEKMLKESPERVLRQGFLYYLKNSRAGNIKQWKRFWVVLRPISITFYKDEQEYSAIKVIEMSSVINAVDLDPLSRTKQFCWQIITEEKTYRFACEDEESLAKWVGAVKSIVARRMEAARTVDEGIQGTGVD